MRRIHPTWVLTMACGGVVLGVAAAQWVAPTMWYSVAWLIAGLGLLAAVLIRPRRGLLAVALIAGLLIGAWRGAQEQMQLTLYDPVRGQAVAMRGVVLDDVDVGKRGEMIMRLGGLESRGKSLPGQLWVITQQKAAVQRGDTVVFEGKLADGFGSFAASVKNAKLLQVIRPQPSDPALALRDGFAAKVREVVSEPEASLGIGYVVGQRRALPDELDKALKIAGLTHIVVASGYNLTILVRFAKRWFEKVSRYLVGAVSAALIAGFIAITGLSPSMVRAGLVSSLGLWAWYVGRKFHPVTLLLVAASATLLWQPEYAWGDLGWELSFAAFAGVMLVAPLIHAYFWGQDTASPWRQVLIETFAAQLVTAPIIVVAFGTLSLIAPLSNMLILPFVPLAMALTGAAGMVHWLVPSLGMIGLPAQWLLGYMTYIAETAAKVSWAQVDVRLEWWGVAIYYGVIVAACAYMKWRTGYNLRNSSIVE